MGVLGLGSSRRAVSCPGLSYCHARRMEAAPHAIPHGTPTIVAQPMPGSFKARSSVDNLDGESCVVGDLQRDGDTSCTRAVDLSLLEAEVDAMTDVMAEDIFIPS